MRFEGEKRVRVWRGLSYCLKKIKSNLNSLDILVAHVKNYQQSLIDDIVFGNFTVDKYFFSFFDNIK